MQQNKLDKFLKRQIVLLILKELLGGAQVKFQKIGSLIGNKFYNFAVKLSWKIDEDNKVVGGFTDTLESKVRYVDHFDSYKSTSEWTCEINRLANLVVSELASQKRKQKVKLLYCYVLIFETF